MDGYHILFTITIFLGSRFRYGFVWTLTVLIAHHSLTLSDILTKPMNTMSFVGNKTRIECSRDASDLPIDWEFNSVDTSGTPGFSYIYINRRFTKSLSSRYKIDTDGTSLYDIVIDSVDFYHAGSYRCTGGLTSASAELIVLGINFYCISITNKPLLFILYWLKNPNWYNCSPPRVFFHSFNLCLVSPSKSSYLAFYFISFIFYCALSPPVTRKLRLKSTSLVRQQRCGEWLL